MIEDGETGLLVAPRGRRRAGERYVETDRRPRASRTDNAAGESARRFTAEAVLPRLEALYVEITATQVTSNT